MTHRVISLPCGILSLSGNSGHRSRRMGWRRRRNFRNDGPRCIGLHDLSCRETAGYAFRFCSSSYGGRVGFNSRPTDLCDLPDGQISRRSVCRLSRSRAKNFPLFPSGKSPLPTRPVPLRQEGRFAIVTDVECGMRWTRMAPLTNGVNADGEVVWS